MTRAKLIEAIKNKKSISFTYIKEGKDPGIREEMGVRSKL